MEGIALKKGNELEKAVELIERFIIETKPSLEKSTITFEPKKILIVDEIKHEIDLYVEIDLGHGYKSIVIFECKNWEKPVGKNEIIIFSEKIRVTQAQRGYIIAKKFGKYSIAQAKLDSRVELIRFSEIPFVPSALLNFHFIVPEIKHIDMFFRSNNLESNGLLKLDHQSLSVKLDGEFLDFLPYVEEKGKSIMEERLAREPTETLDPGIYNYDAEEDLDFEEGRLIVNESIIQGLKLSIKFSNTLIRPQIVSKFDVETRGRVIQFDNVNIEQDSKIGVSFIYRY
ncbi:hypothetical protein PseudUWO311_23280 [Pseudanabaena sp. UWO311]|uniref:hypothetical protein n=1 Tax=Pseudanabaena sp. UWO311 TaxID=2487337 RepID=UPI0011576BAF|nr:hypothetical protein [Pseudanabaena sp. UWO311]TYQ23296.1 hypothetical protein PseudUWO311_23280 [Pseudanabaena sp. UWO311]